MGEPSFDNQIRAIWRHASPPPVFFLHSHIYEYSAIKRWLDSHNTSPRTGKTLPDKVPSIV